MEKREVLKQLFHKLEKHHQTETLGEFLNYKTPEELSQLLDLDCKSEGDFEQLLLWIDKYLEYSLKTGNPSFVNRMWAGANFPSMLGELTTAVSNSSSCTYESAPVSTLMENYMIKEMLSLVGFKSGEGQMTTGSSNANMIAMMCARNMASENVKNSGLFQSKPLYAFVNQDAHYSMDKAANILGIGTDNLIKIPVNSMGEMQLDVLENEIEVALKAGGIPFFVTATAGTTVRGAYDAIEPLLAMKKKYDFWLHVDGAWGGAAIMSDKLKKRYLDGVEKADSFTCDFHKMLGSSLMCNFLLVNNSTTTFNQVLAGGDGSYLFRNTEDEHVYDLGTLSLQCGRRVDALKWFLDWKFFGKKGFGERIDKYHTLCEFAEEVIASIPELELVVPRSSFNLCFRYKFQANINTFNQELRTRLYTRGLTLVGIAYIEHILTMRLLICNINVEKEAIKQFFQHVIEVGKEIESEINYSQLVSP